jgi:predicted thioesterase
MNSSIVSGMEGETSTVVTEEQTARYLGSGSVAVMGTPALVALMERASVAAVSGRLAEGESTVGARIDVKHLAPTPVGMRVTARARLEEVEGRKLHFRIEARDDGEKVGEAVHLRVVIDAESFGKRAADKASQPSEKNGGRTAD